MQGIIYPVLEISKVNYINLVKKITIYKFTDLNVNKNFNFVENLINILNKLIYKKLLKKFKQVVKTPPKF